MLRKCKKCGKQINVFSDIDTVCLECDDVRPTRIAIVGSSKAHGQHIMLQVKELVEKLVSKDPSVIIVSGGAPGIDSMAKSAAESMGIEPKTFPPKTYDWNGYRERNIAIAEFSDKVYSLALPLTDKKTQKACYHCNSDTHQKTAGCWTAKEARKRGKQTELIILKN